MFCQVLTAHTCNPNYSGGRDQEDGGSKPALANSSRDPILKNPSQKMAGGVAQDKGSEFKPQYHTHTQKKKKKKKKGVESVRKKVYII
jgi:hypothetical protein